MQWLNRSPQYGSFWAWPDAGRASDQVVTQPATPKVRRTATPRATPASQGGGVVVRHPVHHTQISPAPKPKTCINAQPLSLWQRRDWKPKGHTLYGYFRVKGIGAVKGEIHNYRSRKPSFYVIDPPTIYSHQDCFHRKDAGRWWVHFNTLPGLDAGIVAVEKIMADALKRRT